MSITEGELHDPEISQALLKQILDPNTSDYPFSNSGDKGLQSFSVRATFSGTATGDVVLLVWQPSTGVNSFTAYVLGSGNIFQDTSGDGEVAITGLTMTIAPVFAPILAQMNPISVQPGTSGNYPFGRIVTGKVHMYSNQTSTTTACLSGTISAGVLSQLSSMSGKQLSTVSIVQQDLLKKDSYLSHRIDQGVVSIVGPDITEPYEMDNTIIRSLPNFMAANVSVQNFLDPTPATWSYYLFSVADIGVKDVVGQTTVPMITTPAVPAGWAGTFPIPWPNSPYAPWAEIQVTVANQLKDASGNPLVAKVVLQHLYISYDTTLHQISNGTDGHIYEAVNNALEAATGAFPQPNLNPVSVIKDKPFYIPGALYIGTLMMVWIPPGASEGNLQIRQVMFFDEVSNHVLGPSRVFRVDNLAEGQQVLIAGTIFAEATPTQSLAPYIQLPGGIMPTQGVVDVLARLFGDPSCSFLRRIYDLDMWKKLTEPNPRSLMGQSFTEFLTDLDGQLVVLGKRKSARDKKRLRN
jgi:hypothetical protein